MGGQRWGRAPWYGFSLAQCRSPARLRLEGDSPRAQEKVVVLGSPPDSCECLEPTSRTLALGGGAGGMFVKHNCFRSGTKEARSQRPLLGTSSAGGIPARKLGGVGRLCCGTVWWLGTSCWFQALAIASGRQNQGWGWGPPGTCLSCSSVPAPTPCPRGGAVPSQAPHPPLHDFSGIRSPLSAQERRALGCALPAGGGRFLQMRLLQALYIFCSISFQKCLWNNKVFYF